MATDQEIRNAGILYMPQQKYLQNPYNLPVTPPVEDGGITNIASPRTINNGGNNFKVAGNNFQNNTNVLGLRTPGSDFASSGNYVTNRTNSGSMLPGAEEEENFLQKILKAGGRGIASMIPGAGMLTSVADKFDRYDDLNPLDQEFIQSQMSGYEDNIHGTQNLPQQDRYGYNKRSALGNYSELVDKRMDIAKGFINKDHPDADEDGYYRPIDKYYSDKFKDKNTIQSQMDMNDIVRNRAISNKLRSGDPKNNPSSKDYQPVGPNSPPTPSNNDNGNQNQGGGGASDISDRDRGGYATDDTASFFARGGRAGYFFGGRVNYKAGGRTDAGPNRTTASHSTRGQINESGQQVSGGQTTRDNNNGGNDNNPPVTVVEDQTSIFDTSGLKSKSPEIGFNYTDPKNYASLKGSVYNKNILDNDDINVKGNLSGEIGPVSYDTSFTDQGITGTNLTAGNFNAGIDANKNYNIGYANNYNGIDYGAKYDNNGNLMFSAGVNFKNGGLAGLL